MNIKDTNIEWRLRRLLGTAHARVIYMLCHTFCRGLQRIVAKLSKNQEILRAALSAKDHEVEELVKAATIMVVASDVATAILEHQPEEARELLTEAERPAREILDQLPSTKPLK